MYCKICGNHLYEELDIRVLFKWKYYIHLNCEVYKFYDLKTEIIPIENNIIEFVYLLEEEMKIIEENLFFFYGFKYFDYLLKKEDWSIAFWYEKMEYDNLPDMDKYLFFKLSNYKIIYMSLYSYQ